MFIPLHSLIKNGKIFSTTSWFKSIESCIILIENLMLFTIRSPYKYTINSKFFACPKVKRFKTNT